MRQDKDKFEERGAQVIAIGPEKPRDFAKFWVSHDMPFIGVPDPEHKVADLFGQEFKLFKLGRMPAQVVVDKKGIIRFAHYGSSMADVPENKEILEIIDQMED